MSSSVNHFHYRESLTSSKGSEDGFGLLKDLPAEQLELLANCDIRYSLPAQGLPVQAAQAAAQPRTAAVLQKQLGLPVPADSSKKQMPSPKQQQQQQVKPLLKHLDVRVVPTHSTAASYSGSCVVSTVSPAGSSLSAAAGGGGGPDRLAYLRSWVRGETPAPRVMSGGGSVSSTTPGSYSHIFLRFYEDFVQITMAAASARLTGSLSPPGMTGVPVFKG